MIVQATSSNPAVGQLWRSGSTLLSALVLGTFLSGVSPLAAISEPPAQVGFDRYEIITGAAPRQTVLSGDFLGGPVAEIAVVHIDENDNRRLQMYGFDGAAWVSVVDARLGTRVLFVDVARIGGRDRLITYEDGRLNWFDPDSATEHALVEVAVNYNSTPSGLGYAGLEAKGPVDEGEVPLVDITRDLNGNGRDDLIIPDVDGFRVFIQMRDGSFAEPVKLGPPEPFHDQIAFGDTRTYGGLRMSPLTIPWYLSRVHQMDYDQDGRTDLVFWNEGHFDGHRQDARGLFSPVAETFTLDVPFDSDGLYSHIFGFGEASSFSLVFGFRKKTRRTVLRSIRDLNGDGVADLLSHSMEGRSILKQHSRYEVYSGARTPGGIVFARDASSVIRPRGKAGGLELGGYSSMWFEDFNGDGQVDIMRGDIKIGIGAVIRALLGTSISMGAELFSMKDGLFPERATARRTVRSDIDVRGGGRNAGFFPSVVVGDVNGDGCSDVLVGKSREKLHVYLGMAGPEMLAPHPQEVVVTLPGDERNSWLVDLNRDGKHDLLMHHPPIDDEPTRTHRLTMLIAR